MFDWIRLLQLEVLGVAQYVLDQAEFLVEDAWHALR